MTPTELVAQFPAPAHHPVLITEVTRMTRGYYCVAGWDIHSRRMVRPLQASGENWRLEAGREVFRVGNVVDCSPLGRQGAEYPHATEDLPLTQTPVTLDTWDEAATYAFLLPTTVPAIRAVFGQALVDDKYLVAGTRVPSLGGVRLARRRARFEEDGYGKLRLVVDDSDGAHYRLPVTCDYLRHLFAPGDADAEPFFGTAEANEWLEVTPPETEVILRIGLARGWAGPSHNWDPRRCYVQLNGIVCPEDNYYIFAGPPGR